MPPGGLGPVDFLRGVFDQAQAQLPEALRDFTLRPGRSLAKAYYADPAVHYEAWFHRSHGRLELGLHFEHRDPVRNEALLAYMMDNLVLLKAAICPQIEAEPWDRGWSRVYQTMPLEPLTPAFQARVSQLLATMIRCLEPLLRLAGPGPGLGPSPARPRKRPRASARAPESSRGRGRLGDRE